MHKLLEIKSFVMTRLLTLENENTGTVDICFDDSDVVSNNDFSFMKKNESYDCKIKLFGNVVDKLNNDKSTFLCTVKKHSCQIGKTNFVMISTENNDNYYIPKSIFYKRKMKNEFYFKVVRKDIIQVNENLHGDYI